MPVATKPRHAVRKKRAATTPKKDIAASCNQYKLHDGRQYTGMEIGRSHKWYYDKGEWRERKITPDMWEISYAVTKRRAGKAPEGSGVPVGSGYHWFILTHQFVHKLNANDYSTAMTGLKLKVAHMRASKGTWNISEEKKRQNLIRMLKEFIAELERDPKKLAVVPLDFEFNGKQYKGMAVPMMMSCQEGVCTDLDVTLNNKHLGVIRCKKDGWRMTNVKPQGLVNAIGEQIHAWYK